MEAATSCLFPSPCLVALLCFCEVNYLKTRDRTLWPFLVNVRVFAATLRPGLGPITASCASNLITVNIVIG